MQSNRREPYCTDMCRECISRLFTPPLLPPLTTSQKAQVPSQMFACRLPKPMISDPVMVCYRWPHLLELTVWLKKKHKGISAGKVPLLGFKYGQACLAEELQHQITKHPSLEYIPALRVGALSEPYENCIFCQNILVIQGSDNLWKQLHEFCILVAMDLNFIH